MKVAIIGAGNMGGAIARGLTQGSIVRADEITVSDLDAKKLDELKAFNQAIKVTNSNKEAVADAELVIVAVKPWLVEVVLENLTLDSKQILISVAAGVDFDRLVTLAGNDLTLFRIVPNTAISELASMTLIASRNASKEEEQLIVNIFNEMGLAMLIPESQIGATMALTSCGIAYVLKYIQAAMQAGVEMGIYPNEAMKMVAQSVKGAAELILNHDTHPSVEIDKVTTPGGITIKGINELEHAGFSSAVIRAIKASNK